MIEWREPPEPDLRFVEALTEVRRQIAAPFGVYAWDADVVRVRDSVIAAWVDRPAARLARRIRRAFRVTR